MLYPACQVSLYPFCLGFLYPKQMSIGTRLRQIRTSNSLSQDKLGELCGVTKGMVSQWELDIVTPPTDRLLLLRKHVKFSFDWLLSDEPVYSTTDPKIISVCRVMEPQAEYVKDAATAAVLTTCELATRAKANGQNS